jgi:c-di-GMP-binding flagellar brake protein YcgR
MGANSEFDPVLKADERFTLRSRPEIVAVLRSLAKQRSMVTVYFDQGREFILTTILAVNPDFHELVLDLGADIRANKRLLQATHLELVGYEGRIKVQFSANHAEATVHEGHSAFRMRIPGAVLRLQRRDFYRVQLPMGKPIKAYLQLFAGRPDQLHEARLVDISCGGLAMILTTVDFPIEIGQVYPACSINLPGAGTLSAPLEITYVSDVALNNGTRQRRAGCRFIELPGPMQSMIQRYINHVEREGHRMRR